MKGGTRTSIKRRWRSLKRKKDQNGEAERGTKVKQINLNRKRKETTQSPEENLQKREPTTSATPWSSPRKFGRWQQRFGKLNEHNGLVPRDHQIEDWERQGIIAFFYEYPLEGYRRLTFMMLDRNLVAVSPSTVYRVLKAAGLLQGRFSRPSRKGKGFVQPLEPHQHWHMDFSFINGSSTLLSQDIPAVAASVAHRADQTTSVRLRAHEWPRRRPRLRQSPRVVQKAADAGGNLRTIDV